MLRPLFLAAIAVLFAGLASPAQAAAPTLTEILFHPTSPAYPNYGMTGYYQYTTWRNDTGFALYVGIIYQSKHAQLDPGSSSPMVIILNPGDTFDESAAFFWETGSPGVPGDTSSGGEIFYDIYGFDPDVPISYVTTPATFAFGNLSQVYDGAIKSATVTSSPADATFTSSLTSTSADVGSYPVTATANGVYTGSGADTLVITPATPVVSLSPSGSLIPAGGSVTFTASGGPNAYVWGGSASGSGSTQTITFPSSGVYSVTVYSVAGGNYAQSNTSTATVAVTVTSVSFTFGNLAQNYDGSVKTATVTPNPAGATYVANLTSSSGAIGSYLVTATATGAYTGSGVDTLQIQPGIPVVTLSPPTSSITVGSSITFTASGGQNAYVWGGSASGSGNGQTVSFPAIGSYTVTVYSDAGGNYSQSAVATATINVSAAPLTPTTFAFGNLSQVYDGAIKSATVTPTPAGADFTSSLASTSADVGSYPVSATATGTYTGSGGDTLVITQAMPTVVLTPSATSVLEGESVTFTVSGGQNSYVWGGSASGTGSSQTVTFPTSGSYTATVYSTAGGNYQQSAVASVSVTVLHGTPAATGATAVTFSIAPLTFVYNGAVQGPIVSATPAGAPMTVSGTASATDVGTYSLSADASSDPASGLTAGAVVTSPDYNGYSAGTRSAVFTNNTSAPIAVPVMTQSRHSGLQVDPAVDYQIVTVAPGGTISEDSSYWLAGPGDGMNEICFDVSTLTTLSGSSGLTPWSITPATPVVSLSPLVTSIPAGGAVTFTASGGTNAYVWGGSATGSGTTKTLSFPTAGVFTVTVYSAAGGNYGQSSTVSATVTVTSTPVTFTFGSLSQVYDGGIKTATVTPNPAGADYTASLSSASANVGSYPVTAAGAGAFTGVGSDTLVITPAPSAVTLVSDTLTVKAGGAVHFTASGGHGDYVWSGVPGADGAATQTAIFPLVGTFTVTVYSLASADGNYAPSPSQSAIVTVTPLSLALSVAFSHTGTATTHLAAKTSDLPISVDVIWTVKDGSAGVSSRALYRVLHFGLPDRTNVAVGGPLSSVSGADAIDFSETVPQSFTATGLYWAVLTYTSSDGDPTKTKTSESYLTLSPSGGTTTVLTVDPKEHDDTTGHTKGRIRTTLQGGSDSELNGATFILKSPTKP